MKIIDLFSGVGGFSKGAMMASENNKIVAANEFDPEIAKSYEANHKGTKMIVGDISQVKEQLFKIDADMIIGGPPCQGFSAAGKRNRTDFIDDPRNYLFREYIDVVKNVNPKHIFMENVPGITTMSSGEIIKEIVCTLEEFGYKVSWRIINSSDFGVPQDRKRFILYGTTLKNINPDEFFTRLYKKKVKSSNIRDAIWNLYNVSDEFESKLSDLFDTEIITNNVGTNHSSKAIEMMSKVRPGENRETLIKQGYKVGSKHSGAYGRSEWDKKSKTIITRFDTPSSGRYIHPELNRTFTPREGARIQTFPDSFNFIGSKTSIYKQIGNAVPPYLGKALFENLEEILNESK